MSRSSNYRALSACLLAAVLAACTASEDSSDAFVVRRTNYSVDSGARVFISGRYLAFLADESTTGSGGTNLNDDSDPIPNDSVVIVVDAPAQQQTNLRVAALDMAWIGNELYIVVDEAIDGKNWNPGLDVDEIVLLHWNPSMMAPLLLDVLTDGPSKKLVTVGSQLYYSAKLAAEPGPLQSNLRMVTTSDPVTAAPIPTTDSMGGLLPILVAEDEGLVRMVLDEEDFAVPRNLNGDSDTTDPTVLALMDGRLAAPVIQNVGLAMPSVDAPFRSRSNGSHDWQVGFLVSETFQGDTNLNLLATFDAVWQPDQCAGFEDTDTLDDVLHYIDYDAWSSNPGGTPPRNTGLVGTRRIAISNSFIATITPEASIAPSLGEGTCDLNSDGDKTDFVVRYTQIVAGSTTIHPPVDPAHIHALFDVPGGTHGLAELDNRFVIVASESADGDIDGSALTTFNLLGHVLPSSSGPAFDYTHGDTQAYVGASWMAEIPERSRVLVALEERVGGLISINLSDTDILDSVPTFADLSGSEVTFPGVRIALDRDNGGMVLAKSWGFYRVSESEDNRNWNGDADFDDFVLYRSSLTQDLHFAVGTISSSARPAVEINLKEPSPIVGAFILREHDAGNQDLNGDGDPNDYMVEYFTF